MILPYPAYTTLVYLSREDDLIEFRNHLTWAEGAEGPAGLTRRTGGVLRSELGEISTTFNLSLELGGL